MVTTRQLHRLATRPSEYIRFQRTGRLPEGVRPASPLLDVLKQVGWRDLGLMRHFTLDQRLGYAGTRTFATVAQAMHWLAPAPEVFDAFPAESWRMKNFHRRLSLDDVVECCGTVPERLLASYPRLRRGAR